jgi:hypothetical protein
MSISSQPRPVAAKQAHSFTHHGITVTDDYAWLRDADYPDVTDEAMLAHLNAENAWFEAAWPDKRTASTRCSPKCAPHQGSRPLGAAEGRRLPLLDRI